MTRTTSTNLPPLWHPWIAIVLYVVVAALWFIPDARIERVLKERAS